MRIESGPVIFDAPPSDGDLVILGTISESSKFRVLKARRGSKYVILKTPVDTDTMSKEMLRREYEICCDLYLSHPCIVSVTGFEESSPVGPAIVMEYIDGQSFGEFIETGAMLSQKRTVLKDILDGVDYLHHRGILHNDLKPDNIIVNANGAARIIDFGLSGSDDSVYKGCIGGSDGCTAPEILEGRGPCGAASDIYSIGLLVKLLFAGHRYAAIARRCSHIDPSKRYSSISALRGAIARYDRMPFIVSAVVVTCALVLLALLPIIEKGSANARFDSTKNRFTSEMNSFFLPALERMKIQKYQEFAAIIRGDYYSAFIHYLDSIERAYPMKEDGVIPTEVAAVTEIQRGQWAILDSVMLSKPSITTLPAGEQGALIELVNQGVVY